MIPGPSRDLTIRPIPQLSRCQKVKHNRLFVKVLPMDQELPLAIGQGRLNVYDYFSNLCARLLVDGYGRDGVDGVRSGASFLRDDVVGGCAVPE